MDAEARRSAILKRPSRPWLGIVEQAASHEPLPLPEPCDVCGGPTFELHCKVICPRCGYTRDCGDP